MYIACVCAQHIFVAIFCTGSIRIRFVYLGSLYLIQTFYFQTIYYVKIQQNFFKNQLFGQMSHVWQKAARNILQVFLCMRMTCQPALNDCDADKRQQMEILSIIWTGSIFQVFDQRLSSSIPGPCSPRRIQRTLGKFSESNTAGLYLLRLKEWKPVLP